MTAVFLSACLLLEYISSKAPLSPLSLVDTRLRLSLSPWLAGAVRERVGGGASAAVRGGGRECQGALHGMGHAPHRMDHWQHRLACSGLQAVRTRREFISLSI
jgi:hypothetical protein